LFNNKVLLCTGFHRSATSATANYLDNAGLNLGDKLLGGNISNNGGHYEDLHVVDFHDKWLARSNTSWQFCDEVSLRVSDESLSLLTQYVASRDHSGESWGVKDPRACLFFA